MARRAARGGGDARMYGGVNISRIAPPSYRAWRACGDAAHQRAHNALWHLNMVASRVRLMAATTGAQRMARYARAFCLLAYAGGQPQTLPLAKQRRPRTAPRDYNILSHRGRKTWRNVCCQYGAIFKRACHSRLARGALAGGALSRITAARSVSYQRNNVPLAPWRRSAGGMAHITPAMTTCAGMAYTKHIKRTP